jgi:hypothetical protein
VCNFVSIERGDDGAVGKHFKVYQKGLPETQISSTERRQQPKRGIHHLGQPRSGDT